MLKNFLQSLKCRIDGHLNCGTWIELLLLATIYPLLTWANSHWFIEDGIVENLQLVILLGAIFLCAKAKNNKHFFVFIGLIILFMVLRELSFGRTYLCAHYGIDLEECSWKVFRYGAWAKILRFLFAVGIGIYFVRHKLYKAAKQYFLSAPIYIWEFVVFAIAVLGGTIAEFPCIDNEIFEECCELLSYLTMANLVWRYSRLENIAAK